MKILPLLLVLAAAPAAAQPVLSAQKPQAGLLRADDRRRDDAERSPYRAFTFHGERARTVVFTARSSAFSPAVEVGRTVGGRFRAFGSQEDGDGDGSAAVAYTPAGDQPYEVRVYVNGSDGAGAFVLTVQRAGRPQRAPRSHRLVPGRRFAGALTERSPLRVMRDDSARFEQFAFEGRAGVPVHISVRAPGFETRLEIGAMWSGDFEPLGIAENGGRIVFTPTAGGEYAVRVTTLGYATGEFTVSRDPGG